MYYTKKIRIKTNKQQKEDLLAYERVYHREIHKITSLLCRENRFTKFENDLIDNRIADGSKWYIFQFAKMHKLQNKKGRKASYGRSSTWHPTSFRIIDNYLYLYFGDDFSISQDAYELRPIDNKQENLSSLKILRLDIVHDERYFYANFLVSTNELDEKIRNLLK